MSDSQLTKETVNIEYMPHPSAYVAASSMVQHVFEANGNPETITIDRVSAAKLFAYAIDTTVKACGGSFR